MDADGRNSSCWFGALMGVAGSAGGSETPSPQPRETGKLTGASGKCITLCTVWGLLSLTALCLSWCEKVDSFQLKQWVENSGKGRKTRGLTPVKSVVMGWGQT